MSDVIAPEVAPEVKVETQAEGQVDVNVDELNKVKETLKKISQNYDRLNTEKAKIEKDLKAEREKTLTAKQIEEMRMQEMTQKLDAKEKELFEKELTIAKSDILNARQWDNEFIGIVAGNDIDTFSANVEKLQAKVKKQVEKEVNERLAKFGNTIPNTGKPGEDLLTIDQLSRIDRDKMKTDKGYETLVNRSMAALRK